MNDRNIKPFERLTAEHNARLFIVSLGGAIAVATGLAYTARNYRLSQRGQFTDRFTKALERLGSDELYVRIGAIHALEHLMQDSIDHHGDVVRVLVAFIRNRAPRSNAASGLREASVELVLNGQDSTVGFPREPEPDVQAALFVLAQRRRRASHEVQVLDFHDLHLRQARAPQIQLQSSHLGNTDLRNADLNGAQLQGANLEGADLRGANLEGAQLSGARMKGADLRGARLSFAQLDNASLEEADLRNANLDKCQLKNAKLDRTRLENAILSDANMRKASLSHADLRECYFGGADLHGAHLYQARLQKAHLRYAKLEGASLPGAQLDEADFGDLTIDQITRLLARTLTDSATALPHGVDKRVLYEYWESYTFKPSGKMRRRR